jgi:hypothetical protein
MLANLILAITLITIAICAILTLNQAINIGSSVLKAILRFTRRSKLLTEFILRAYLRYRRTINKPYLN